MLVRSLCCLLLLALPVSASQMIYRPPVGVVGSGPESMSVRYIMAALYDAGARPVLLDVRRPEDLQQHLDVVRGIVLAGNSLDINPTDYGANPHPKTVNEDTAETDSWGAARDEYEYAIIDAVIERGIPFLGICGGMQRLNVAGHAKDGGTLNQHIDGQLQRDASGKFRPPHLPHETIRLVAGSKLAAVVAQRELPANSLHHQHVGRVRDGFRPAAIGESGVIEAIEPEPSGPYGSHPFLIGVQWHPEYHVSAADRALLKRFMSHVHEMKALLDEAAIQAVDAAPKALHDITRGGVKYLRDSHGYNRPEALEGSNAR